MAQHDVTFSISNKLVQRKDVEFEIKKDGLKLGTLLISKGNIEWVPSGNHVNKSRMSWGKFAELMASQGKPAKLK